MGTRTQDRCPLRQDAGRFSKPLSPLLPGQSSASVPNDRYLERLRGRHGYRARPRELRQQERWRSGNGRVKEEKAFQENRFKRIASNEPFQEARSRAAFRLIVSG